MNQVYRLVWNMTLGAWVAVSETARSKGKSSTNKLNCALATATLLASGQLIAGNVMFDGKAPKNNSIAIGSKGIGGQENIARGEGEIAIGDGSRTGIEGVVSSESIALGFDAYAKGDQSVAIGGNVRANGNSSVSIGGDDLDKVANTGNVVIPSKDDRALLSDAEKEALNELANNSDAAQTFNKLTGQYLVNFGLDSKLQPQYTGTDAGDGAVSIGVQALAGDLATAFGTRATAKGKTSVALGVAASATFDGSVAIGAGSQTDKSATDVKMAEVSGIVFGNFAGTTGGNVGRQISVGTVGFERQIKNVAPGEISKTSTDAINGSQLVATIDGLVNHFETNAAVVYTTANNVQVKKVGDNWYTLDQFNYDGSLKESAKKYSESIITAVKSADGSTTKATTLTNVANGEISDSSMDAINGSQLKGAITNINTKMADYFGAGTNYNSSTGVWTPPKYQVKNAKGEQVADDAADVGTALTNLNNYVNLGFNIQQNGTSKYNVTPGANINFVDGNTTNVTVSDSGQIKVEIKDQAIIDTTVNNAQNIINNAQLPVAYTDSYGNKVYKHTDGNWYTAQNGMGDSVNASNIIASMQDANGNTKNPTKLSNVAEGVINSSSKDAVNGSQLFQLVGKGAYQDQNGNTYHDDQGNPTLNIGGTGKNNINDAIQSINSTATKAKTTVSEGKNILVTVSENKDGSTNYEVKTKDNLVANSLTAGNTILNKDGLSFQTVQLDNEGKVVTDEQNNPVYVKNAKAPSVTVNGIDAGNNKITNLAPGTVSTSSTDAVNGSQLMQSKVEFATYLGGNAYDPETQTIQAPTYQVNGDTYHNVGDALGALNQADQSMNQRITNLGDQLEQSFRSTNKRIDDVEKRANAGIAAAIALETAPYIAGKWTYAAAAAHHSGENAVGVTLRKTADNGRWSLTSGIATASQGDPSFRIGVSGVID